MSVKRALFKNSLIYGIGTFGSKALSFLLLPIYTFFLSKGDLGFYDLVVTTIGLLAPLISMQLGDAVYRFLLGYRNDLVKIQKCITNGIILLVGSIIIFTIIITIILSYLEIKYEKYLLIILMLSCLYPFVQQGLRGLGRNKVYAIVGILYIINLLFFNLIFLVWLDLGIEGLLLATILANLLAIMYSILKINFISYIRPELIDRKEMIDMVRYSGPLIPNTISWWLINASDKYIILFFLTIEDNGLYAVSNKIPTIIIVLNSIFMLAWQDQMLLNDTKKDRQINSQIFRKFIVYEMSLVILFIAMSQFIISFLIAESFFKAWRYMPFLFLGVAYMAFSGFLGTAYLKARNTLKVFTTSIIGGVVNIAISYFLIERIGLFAPALGTFVSFLIVFCLRSFQTLRYFDFGAYYRELLGYTVIALIIIFLVLLDTKIASMISICGAGIIFIINGYPIVQKIKHGKIF